MDKLVENTVIPKFLRHPEDNPAAQEAVATEIAMGALALPFHLLKITQYRDRLRLSGSAQLPGDGRR